MTLPRKVLEAILTGNWKFRFICRQRTWTLHDLCAYITLAILDHPIARALLTPPNIAAAHTERITVDGKRTEPRSRSQTKGLRIATRTSGDTVHVLAASNPSTSTQTTRPTDRKSKRTESIVTNQTSVPQSSKSKPNGDMPPNDVIAIIVVVIFALVVLIGLIVYWLTVLIRPRKVVAAEAKVEV